MSEPPGKRPRRAVEVLRVQRPTVEFPIVHLEADIPAPKRWSFDVRGLAATSPAWDLDDLRRMPLEERVLDLHCVWGWTRPALRWEGIPLSRLIDAARPLPSATHVVARQIEGPYASCLTMAEARGSLLALRVDGADIEPEHGGPLRLIPPANKWGYKSVKWVGFVTLVDTFTPGFWEAMVGNPVGTIPPEMLDLRFEPQEVMQ